jgi:hypothetical protein
MKIQHMEAPAPAAPRHGGRWGILVLCFHMYEAPSGAPGRHRKAGIKAEVLFSNIAYVHPPRQASHSQPTSPRVRVACVWEPETPKLTIPTPTKAVSCARGAGLFFALVASFVRNFGTSKAGYFVISQSTPRDGVPMLKTSE